jgi:hypothetical protein
MDRGRPPRGSFAPVDLTHRRPPIERWAVIAAVALVIVVTKPWPSSGGSDQPTRAPETGSRHGTGSGPSAVPSPSNPEAGAESLVAAFCLNTRLWLVASVERSVERTIDQRIRVWRALEPATAASGPDDPTIPDTSVVSEGLTELGWCAPVIGNEKPTPPVDIAVWLRTAGVARPITLDSSRPLSDRSPYGELYGPPGKGPSSRAASWPDGTYVFRYREADGRERWFAIEVEIRRRPSPAP